VQQTSADKPWQTNPVVSAPIKTSDSAWPIRTWVTCQDKFKRIGRRVNILYLVLFVVIVLLSAILNAPKIRGARGESRVARLLSRLDNSKYKALNDIVVRTGRGTSQIDHVVVSTQGIFVIETKNYSGWIHGGETSEYWTQTFYRTKFRFRNPTKQNWAHVFALRELLHDFGSIAYHPIVVFTGSSELKNVYSEMPVIYVDDLLRTISETRGDRVLSNDQIVAIQSKLEQANILDADLRKEHVRLIQDRTRVREHSNQLLLCPNCGGTLVSRSGKYGQFYGCRNYPRCRYIKKL
jgi:hypothetical protein